MNFLLECFACEQVKAMKNNRVNKFHVPSLEFLFYRSRLAVDLSRVEEIIVKVK
jgi:hypothetical protein